MPKRSKAIPAVAMDVVATPARIATPRTARAVAWNGTDPSFSDISTNGLTANYGQFTNESCHQCRLLHPLLSRAIAHYDSRLAVMIVPVPITDTPRDKSAGEYARLSLALWHKAPRRFPDFHDWLMDGPTPPTPSAVRKRAEMLLGDRSLGDALTDPRIEQGIVDGGALYASTNPLQLPKLLTSQSVIWGDLQSSRNLIQIPEAELGKPETAPALSVAEPRLRKPARLLPKHSYRRKRIAASIAAVAFVSGTVHAQLSGALDTHDPSSIIKDGSMYFDYNTGQGIAAKWSSDGITWNDETSGVFSSPPAWTTQHVSGFTGLFWAPDVAYFNGLFHLYYAASTWGSTDSGIGVATSPALNRAASNYGFVDQGKVVASQAVGFTDSYTDETAFNAIDPSILVDNNTGKVWMSWGSYSSGIVVTQLDPSTGKPLNGYNATLLANNATGGGWGSSIEGSAIIKQGSYYYLFVNYGGCCSGVSSTYNIRVGRSTSPTGPFIDKNGVDMRNGGGTMFLSDNGRFIGPGHFARFVDTDGTDYFSYHYYNGDATGAPTLNKQKLYWTSDNWPSAEAINPDWAGTFNGNWTQSGNWWNAVVPNGAGAVANFGARTASTASVTLDAAQTVSTVNFHNGGPNFTIQNAGYTLTVQPDSYGNNPAINALGGFQTINAPISASARLAVNVFGNNAATWLLFNGAVTAPGLTKYGFGTLVLNGSTSFTDSTLVKYGAVEINGSVTTNQFTSVGHVATENGTLWVRNSGRFTTSADLNIGDSGDATDPASGTLYLRDNAIITVNSTGGFYVGSGFYSNTKAAGVVNQSGGTLTANGNFDGAFIIGGRTSKLAVGTYNFGGGAVNANTNVRVGGYGAGTMNQSAGGFNASGYISIGRYAGATGTWNLSGGSLNQNNATAALIVGESGAGTLIVSGTGQLFTMSALRIGYSVGGSGVVNLNGGALTVPSITRGSGSARFNFNGGTVRASATNGSFMQGLSASYVQGGGAMLDTQTFNITIGQPLLHDPALGTTIDGGLSKLGSGSLTLTASNTYTGVTTINGGALVLKGASAQNPVLNAGGADLKSGKLLLDYTGGSDPVSSVNTILGNAYTSNFASGQIHTSNPQDLRKGIGYVDNTGTSQVSMMYTYCGDVNLDGQVTTADFTTLATNFDKPGTWQQGDFNFDGTINALDFNAIAINFGATPISTGASLPGTLVPEPAPLIGLAIGSLLTIRKRNRV